MGSGLLEPDRSVRNIIIFVVALLVCGSFSAFYFIQNHGCDEYPQHLKECSKFTCTQRIMGFENERMGRSALTLKREILGLEKDKFYDFSTCTVIETDDTSKNEPVTCKYSDKTRADVLKRSLILFGAEPSVASEGSKATEADVVRASYAKRTEAQEKECTKQ